MKNFNLILIAASLASNISYGAENVNPQATNPNSQANPNSQTSNPSTQISKNEAGTVVSLKGKAWLTPSNSDQKLALKKGSVIRGGDTISTAPGTQMTFTLGDKDAAVLVKKESRFTIEMDPEKNWLLDVKQGEFLTHVRHLHSTPPNHFRVKTRNAVMGVRGTTFFIKDVPGKNVFLCVCEGLVTVDNKVLIYSRHHDAPREILSGTQPVASRLINAPMGQDHTDKEAKELIDLVKP